ncbi:MAG: hypothetical protein V8S89_04235 [Oscillospiraceae bacterium]
MAAGSCGSAARAGRILLPGYAEGLFYVQDARGEAGRDGAGRCSPGMRGAGLLRRPGRQELRRRHRDGKPAAIISCDMHEKSNRIIEGRTPRPWLHLREADGRPRGPAEDWRGQLDAVICDVPCSGLGVIRKKPDIRYKSGIGARGAAPACSGRSCAASLRPPRRGAALQHLYDLQRENEGVIAAFLE